MFFKKSNSLYTSRPNEKAVCQIMLDGQPIFWEFWIEAYEFNMQQGLHIFRGLTKDHVYLNAPLKM